MRPADEAPSEGESEGGLRGLRRRARVRLHGPDFRVRQGDPLPRPAQGRNPVPHVRVLVQRRPRVGNPDPFPPSRGRQPDAGSAGPSNSRVLEALAENPELSHPPGGHRALLRGGLAARPAQGRAGAPAGHRVPEGARPRVWGAVAGALPRDDDETREGGPRAHPGRGDPHLWAYACGVRRALGRRLENR